MSDEWLTPGQVAAMFAVTRFTISRWARAGIIPPGAFMTDVNGRRLFSASAMRELQAEGNFKFNEDNG